MSEADRTTPEKPVKKGDKDPYAEDRTKDGWPAVVKSPFVDPKYYAQFAASLRPTFDFGGAVGAQLTMEAAESLQQKWEANFHHITVINNQDKSWETSMLGPERNTLAWASVPPFGVLRGPLIEEVTRGGIQGSRFYLRYPIAPAGDCDDEKEVSEPMANGERISACLHFGCKRAGHFDVARHAHSIKHAQMFALAIGEAMPDSNDPTTRASYIPPFAETEKRLLEFKKQDGRQAVNLFIMDRLEYIRDREAGIRVRTDEGKGVPGR